MAFAGPTATTGSVPREAVRRSQDGFFRAL